MKQGKNLITTENEGYREEDTEEEDDVVNNQLTP
jgi:hypothetical protein